MSGGLASETKDDVAHIPTSIYLYIFKRKISHYGIMARGPGRGKARKLRPPLSTQQSSHVATSDDRPDILA